MTAIDRELVHENLESDLEYTESGYIGRWASGRAFTVSISTFAQVIADYQKHHNMGFEEAMFYLKDPVMWTGDYRSAQPAIRRVVGK